jgi:predicted nuclease of predicted toxin-antitoxin system
MKFKLDENLGDLGLALLEAAGHDVMTVRDQNLVGVSDRKLFGVCQAEGRVLITLDCHFAQFLRFPVAESGGTIVVTCRGRQSPAVIEKRISEVVEALKHDDPTGALWIVEPGRVRIHEKPD